MLREKLQFKEIPTTADEFAIAHLLETIAEGIVKKDISKVGSVYTPDATISLSSDPYLSLPRDNYLQELQSLVDSVYSCFFTDIHILVKSESATVICVSNLHLLGHLRPQSKLRLFLCVRINGEWKIKSARHVN